MLAIGTKAPDFIISDKDGKKIVLYFYSRDNTSGCTKQACAYAKAYSSFTEEDAVVIGISKDSVKPSV